MNTQEEITRLREVVKTAADDLRAQCVGLRVIADLERSLEPPPAEDESSPSNDQVVLTGDQGGRDSKKDVIAG